MLIAVKKQLEKHWENILYSCPLSKQLIYLQRSIFKISILKFQPFITHSNEGLTLPVLLRNFTTKVLFNKITGPKTNKRGSTTKILHSFTN